MNEELPNILLAALPAFMALIAIGTVTSMYRGDGRYRARDTAANLRSRWATCCRAPCWAAWCCWSTAGCTSTGC
jgi:hypothetical protein